MRRWFLSYNSQDLGVIEGLVAALMKKDAESKIFLAPKNLRVGGFWLPELAKEIADATAFVLLVGPSGLGPWQVIEYYEALDRHVKEQGFPVILLLLEGLAAPGLPFLRQLHWITAPDFSSETCLAQLMDAARGEGTIPGALWRHTAPYRGLIAMTEADTDFFFGRGRETGQVIASLQEAPDKLPLLVGNSGVGKSSVAQAGVLAAFLRQGWPESTGNFGAWPESFNTSRRWCVLKVRPGVEPVRALVEPFIRTWQFDPTDPRRETRQSEWVENLTDGRSTLRGLLDATEDRLQEQSQSKPPAFLLYIDQGEELYVHADDRQRRCFSRLVGEGLADPRLRALMSMRADFFGELQRDEALFAIHKLINVPPLREAELGEVVSRPPALLSARFETDRLASSIAKRAAEESTKDAGALPLLSYLLDDMWKQMIYRDDGVLRLPEQAIELGRVLVDRADLFLANHPNAEDRLRRIFTLKLATVSEEGEPTRRRACRSEFSTDEWRLVSELADHPNRLLVTATSDAGETYAEVAHEAIFRRWDRLREWIMTEREFLAWRSGLEAARRAWRATPEASKHDALLMGTPLTQAQNWFLMRADDLPVPDREFIALSIARDNKAQARARRIRQLVYVLLVGMIVSLMSWIEQSFIKDQWLWWTSQRWFVSENIWPYVLKSRSERALIAGDTFRECAPKQQHQDYCPDMVMVPAGTFEMGSPQTDKQAYTNEFPRHPVTIAKRFAVAKFEVTFAEWDACVAGGGCSGYKPADAGWGREEQPAINVNWNDARQYAAWLSRVTGKAYRLLTEAEYEYAARAGTTTAYPWGDEINVNRRAMANCIGCGSEWDGQQAAPVGSFPANRYGLYDMVGNVWEWVEDCYHPNYQGAPADGSAWMAGDACNNRVVRGGSWNLSPGILRSADRSRTTPGYRVNGLGFRIARTLAP